MSIDIQPEEELRSQTGSTLNSASPTPSASSRSNTWWIRILVGVVVLAALGAAAPMILSSVAPDGNVSMLTHTVKRSDLIVSVTEQGTLESSSNTEIKCRVKGGSTVLWVVETGTKVQPGDVLVRLDQSTIEDNISQQQIAYENAVSAKATSESDVAVARIGIKEYLEGTFRSQQTTFEKDVVIAESNLKSSQNALEHAEKMFRKGYTSKLDLEAQRDAVKHAELELRVKKTDLEALETFTKAKELETLNGLLKIAEASLAANEAALDLERGRLERARNQLVNCVIKAEKSGMVIYPLAAAWKEQPDIEEGAQVREDQVLLMMPDLEAMQVKVGIHESKVDRLEIGMPCRIQLQDGFADGHISEIASVSKGGGWWNGNMVKYDTIVSLKGGDSLKPGMSVSVEVFLARHTDVLTVPVASVLELNGAFYCWLDRGGPTPEKRQVTVGDSNDTHVIIREGVKEGDQIVLNPRDFIDEARADSLKAIEESAKPDDVPVVETSQTKKPAGDAKQKPGGKKGAAGKKEAAGSFGAKLVRQLDKNKDGGVSKDELPDQKSKQDFEKNDTNSDGKLDAAEIDQALKQGRGDSKK